MVCNMQQICPSCSGLPHIDEESDKSGSEDESGASSQSEEEEDSEEEDEEDTDEEDEGNPAGPSFKGLPSEETVPGSHRSRRRAVFSDEPVPATTDGSSDEEEEEIDDEEEEQMQARLQSSSSAGSSGRDSDADSQDSEGETDVCLVCGKVLFLDTAALLLLQSLSNATTVNRTNGH